MMSSECPVRIAIALWGAALFAGAAGSAFAAMPVPRVEGFPTGTIVEGVACQTDPTQTYSLYLPRAYDSDRRWPLLLVLDPRGRGTEAAEIFREAAEAFGWIVVSSNDTRSDSPMEPNVKAVAALWPEVHTRFSTDPKRLYAAGFSGTVSMAWALGVNTGALSGVVGAGARLEPDLAGRPVSFAFFGAAGRHDFNYLATVALVETLAGRGAAWRLEHFDGAHQWLTPELATLALGWFDVLAMKDRRRPRNDEMVAEQLATERAGAETLAARGRPLEAMRRYEVIARTFDGLADVGSATRRAREISATGEVKRALDAERSAAEWERRFVIRLRLPLTRLVDPEAYVTVREAVSALFVASLKSEAQKPSYKGDAANRLLNWLMVQTSFYVWRELIERGDFRRAVFFQDVAAEIDPDSPAPPYRQAVSYARAGDTRRALESLERAVAHGLASAALLLEEPAFDALKKEEAFDALVRTIRSREPKP